MNALGRQLVLELLAGVIVADHADEIDGTAEGPQVVRHIRGAAEPDLFIFEDHHRHGRFRRDAADAADHEAIEHHVAEHGDAA